MTRWSRFIKINWTSFAHTRHWLRGVALVDYLLRTEYLPGIREALGSPSLLARRLVDRAELDTD